MRYSLQNWTRIKQYAFKSRSKQGIFSLNVDINSPIVALYFKISFHIVHCQVSGRSTQWSLLTGQEVLGSIPSAAKKFSSSGEILRGIYGLTSRRADERVNSGQLLVLRMGNYP